MDVFGLVGSVIDQRYRVDSIVGEGGFGVVYRGHHLSFDHPIAIKCLKVPMHFNAEGQEIFLQKFREEGKILSRLSHHPAIVRVFDLGVTTARNGQQVPYLVLEWLQGTPLSRFLEERRGMAAQTGLPPGMSEPDTLALMRPIVEALATVHAEGIAHRDIKPENIFYNPMAKGSRAKLLDFGIAKAMQEGDRVTRIGAKTSSNFSAFSPQHAAPEQFRPALYGATGPWTDVHALGLLFSELTSGRAPMGQGDFGELLVAATSERRPSPRSLGAPVSEAFEGIVQRCIALDPRHRFVDARDLLAAMDQLERRASAPPGQNTQHLGEAGGRTSAVDAAMIQSIARASMGPTQPSAQPGAAQYAWSQPPGAPPPPGAAFQPRSHSISIPAPPGGGAAQGRRVKGFPWALTIGGLVAAGVAVALLATQPWKETKKRKKRVDDSDERVASSGEVKRPVSGSVSGAISVPGPVAVPTTPPRPLGPPDLAYVSTGDRIWVIAQDGTVSSQASDRVELLEAEWDGSVLYKSSRGIGRLEPGGSRLLASPPPQLVDHIAVSKEGIVYGVGYNWLGMYANGAWSEIPTSSIVEGTSSTPMMRDVVVDPSGAVMVANTGGVYKLIGSIWSKVGASTVIQRMELSPAGELWLLDPLGVRRLPSSVGSTASDVYDLIQTPSAFTTDRDVKPTGHWVLVESDGDPGAAPVTRVSVGDKERLIGAWPTGLPRHMDSHSAAVDTQGRAWVVWDDGTMTVYSASAPPKTIRSAGNTIDRAVVTGAGPRTIPDTF